MFTEGQEILEKRYKVIKKLGGGAFGEIFKGKYSKAYYSQQANKGTRVWSLYFPWDSKTA